MNNVSSPSLATNNSTASHAGAHASNNDNNALSGGQTTAEKLLSQPSSLPGSAQYIVKSGDTLGAIAQRNGVSVEALAAHNGISNPNRIFVGDNLSIPQGGTTTAQTYTIQSGDTLNGIANTYGVSVASIASVNNISNPNRIYPGDTITIPLAASTTTAAQRYEIQPGDTLNDIASNYGVSVASIAAANNISNPNRIYPGDVLTIPGSSAGPVTPSVGTPPTNPSTSPVTGGTTGTSPFNVQAVIDAVPAGVRRANPDIETHVNNILEMSAKHGLSADQTAYVLATATHESALGAYMEEFASGRAYEGRADLGNTETGDGVRFKGRGYVQVTGRANYQDWSNRLGIDLVGNPSLAEQPHIAAEILVVGMKDGSFTGRSLDRYINDGGTDFTNARRIVNGTDRAALIAGYANNFQTALATPAPASVAPSTTATPSSSITETTLGAEGSAADIWVKSTADVDNLSAPITAALDDIVAAWQSNNGPTPVITSGNDGRHSNGSLHYSDNAVDLRTNNISDALSQRIADDLQARLGNDYDVLFERFPNNPSNDHIHVEYDPK